MAEDSKGPIISEPSGKLKRLQTALRERREKAELREKAKAEKYATMAGTQSKRNWRRRKKKETAMLDALVRASNVGGARVGAGRKRNYLKRMGIKPVSAAQLLDNLDVPKIIGDLLNDRNPAIRLQTLNMLMNRAYGLPKETGEIQVSGGTANLIRVEFHKGGAPVAGQNTPPLLEAEVIPEPEPVAETQPPPPLPEPMGNCQYHGDFSLKESKGFNICPQCKKDAERQERWLAGLQPAGDGMQ